MSEEAIPTYPDSLIATAYHEAGHAVMAITCGRSLHKVTIEHGKQEVWGTRAGACVLGKGTSKNAKDMIENEALILYSGMVAEAQFTGQYSHAGAAQDIAMARRLLTSRASNQRQFERLEQRLVNKVESILSEDEQQRAIQAIAQALLKQTSISGRQAQHLFDQYKRDN